MESRNARIAMAPVLLLAVLLASCAGAPSVPKREAMPPMRGIEGTLAAQGIGVSLEGARVTAGDFSVVAGPGGAFAFPGLPLGKNNLVAEKTIPSGAVRRVMGVATVYVSDNPIRITVPVRDATNIDSFCLDCHPYKGTQTRRDQIVRCLHVSGVKSKYQKIPTLPLDAERRITCESCHAIHRDTGIPHQVVAAYTEGTLCHHCH